ncbi:hypothetical protein OO014_08235 [Intrasporangium calvum]|uniref:Uncharacterized protein n=1 Tax=Intrasporangium calvum TaxID=53358 RepID=A0ABT5GG69_9MICO|nr:hypothetical protein [Intrasporangium calvum]MDC5697244.1 hypothetical protein [Intrasporangium calvum]
MSRANRILAIALAGIVVLAVVAALVSRGRPSARLDAGSPEAAVQAYVDAALDGRADEAARWLDPAGDCDVGDLDRAGTSGMSATRVVLVDSTQNADSATVRVDLVFGSGGPFETSEYREPQSYRLVRSSGDWRITGVPWPLYDCWKE